MPSNYLSLFGYERLQGELAYLRKLKHQETAARLRTSKVRSWNDGDPISDFAMVKEQQASLESRIQDLEFLLSNSKFIEYQSHGDMVEIGSKVTISEHGGDPVSYTIVGPIEAAPVRGLISFTSPLGSSLMGRSAGDEVIVEAPGGVYPVRILEVS